MPNQPDPPQIPEALRRGIDAIREAADQIRARKAQQAKPA